ncbi:hypothetical protein SAMN05216262_10666 [Colwellia chukchiensis]|uniref:Uncharacterized protein n=1 Tax=Colwellia chukchiensis TaxID=641665 RepID=A0A1H7MN52_9GAMM|nr:hypothetical protein SAMN05216262_10666 [Colwellia chukchiensis]
MARVCSAKPILEFKSISHRHIYKSLLIARLVFFELAVFNKYSDIIIYESVKNNTIVVKTKQGVLYT